MIFLIYTQTFLLFLDKFQNLIKLTNILFTKVPLPLRNSSRYLTKKSSLLDKIETTLSTWGFKRFNVIYSK